MDKYKNDAMDNAVYNLIISSAVKINRHILTILRDQYKTVLCEKFEQVSIRGFKHQNILY